MPEPIYVKWLRKELGVETLADAAVIVRKKYANAVPGYFTVTHDPDANWTCEIGNEDSSVIARGTTADAAIVGAEIQLFYDNLADEMDRKNGYTD